MTEGRWWWYDPPPDDERDREPDFCPCCGRPSDAMELCIACADEESTEDGSDGSKRR